MTARKSTEAEQTEAPVVPIGDTTDPERDLQTKSYAYASRVLREENEDYFNKLRSTFLERNGITGWEPESVKAKRKAEAKREADEVKAAQTIAKVYRLHPSLAPEGWVDPEGTDTPPEGQEG